MYRDGVWLKQHRSGLTIKAIADGAGVSPRTVQLGLKRARDEVERIVSAPSPANRWWLDLVPLFPIDSFTPQSKCPHHGPIRPGSLFCCMVCSRTGVDGHPALRRDPATDPRPEPKPIEPPPSKADAKPPAPETRRERRKREAEERSRGLSRKDAA
jgi:hypothetical protein